MQRLILSCQPQGLPLRVIEVDMDRTLQTLVINNMSALGAASVPYFFWERSFAEAATCTFALIVLC